MIGEWNCALAAAEAEPGAAIQDWATQGQLDQIGDWPDQMNDTESHCEDAKEFLTNWYDEHQEHLNTGGSEVESQDNDCEPELRPG